MVPMLLARPGTRLRLRAPYHKAPSRRACLAGKAVGHKGTPFWPQFEQNALRVEVHVDYYGSRLWQVS